MPESKRAIASAELFTLLRALSHKEVDPKIRNPDYLAEQFLSKEWRQALRFHVTLKKRFETKTPGAYCYALARTKFIDQVLISCLKQGFNQVLVLGAGNDSRGLRFAQEFPQTTFIELDFPGTQQLKLQKLKNIRQYNNHNMVYIPIDFNQQSIIDVLKNSCFDVYSKTVVIWEGVSFYLKKAVFESTLSFFKAYTPSGSQLTFDYLLSEVINGNFGSFGSEESVKWSKEVNEPFLFGINCEELNNFCVRKNLKVISDIGDQEIKTRFLLDNNMDLLGEPYACFRLTQILNQ